MLTWNVIYHCKPGKREDFYAALCKLGTRTTSVSEAGNRRYDYYFSAEFPDDLLLVETWESPELQQLHCQTNRSYAQFKSAYLLFIVIGPFLGLLVSLSNAVHQTKSIFI